MVVTRTRTRASMIATRTRTRVYVIRTRTRIRFQVITSMIGPRTRFTMTISMVLACSYLGKVQVTGPRVTWTTI